MKPFAATIVLVVLAGLASTDESNETSDGSCGLDESTCALYDEAGPWSGLLREWALTPDVPENNRQGRIMALPPTKGYYITDRMGVAQIPQLPAAHRPPPQPAGPQRKRPASPPGGRPYDEWTPPPHTPAKIVNRPPKPYKEPFKPSPAYNPPPNQQPIPIYNQPTQTPIADRIDENPPPQKQMSVTETDLYLLSAIEKLVYRADLMEKRVRKLEETVHLLVAGVDKEKKKKPEPCATNFTRLGDGCYHVSVEEANWKGANYGCRRLKANMLELDTDLERRKLMSALLSEKAYKGEDFWTGGLNPGLLWIWSHSARPVVTNTTSAASNSTQMATIVGEGRCLGWVHDPALNTYVYRGQDCSLRHRYLCEKAEDKAKLSNEIERVAKMLRAGKAGRRPKIIWTDDDAAI